VRRRPAAVSAAKSLAPVVDSGAQIASISALPTSTPTSIPTPNPTPNPTSDPVTGSDKIAAIADTAPTPVPAPAAQQVASLPPPASSVEQSGIAAPTPKVAPLAPANETTYLSVLDVLAEVPKDPCFAALPTLSDKSEFQLEAFARNSSDLDHFRQALEKRLGRMPNTTMKAISDAQCATMAFVSDGPAYPNFKLFFEIDQRVIKSGDRLIGRIGNATGGVITFLLIDDEGTVQDLSGFLKFVRGGATFSIPMSLTAGPVVTQQLLMALSTPARLITVTDANDPKAVDFFPALAAELRRRGQTEDVALVAFSVR